MMRRGAPAGRIPVEYRAYALVLHLLVAGTCLSGVAAVAGAADGSGHLALPLAAIGEASCLLLLLAGMRRYDGARGGGLPGFGYIVLALLSLATAVLARFGGAAFAAIGIVLLAPWLSSTVVRSLFRSPDRRTAVSAS